MDYVATKEKINVYPEVFGRKKTQSRDELGKWPNTCQLLEFNLTKQSVVIVDVYYSFNRAIKSANEEKKIVVGNTLHLFHSLHVSLTFITAAEKFKDHFKEPFSFS